MRRLILGVIIAVLVAAMPIAAISADTIVTCKNPAGYGNYHYAGIVSKEKSGFTDDKITGGLFTLVRVNKKEYDILFVDVRQTIISHMQDGGAVRLLRKGKDDATFLVFYPGMLIELYTFYRDASGSEHFDILQSKGGDKMHVHKSTLMTGNCSGLNLNLLHNPD